MEAEPGAAAARPRRTRSYGQAAAGVTSLLSILGLLAAVLLIPELHRALAATAGGNLHLLRDDLRGAGIAAALVVVALVLAHTVIPFPAEVAVAGAGFVLGFAVALPLLLLSFLASALMAYAVARWAGRALIARTVGTRRRRQLERFVSRGGPQALIAVRLIPLVPFSPVCVACGLARVPVRRYVWTTVVGMLPQLILVTYLGTRLQNFRASDPSVWVPLLGLLVLLLGGWRLGRRLGLTNSSADKIPT